MTLGNAAAARVRLIVWCKACGHRAEPDPAEIAQRYGAETIVPEWRGRLVCSHCGSRDVGVVGHFGCNSRPLRLDAGLQKRASMPYFGACELVSL
jgi:hypothetical protein